MKYPILKLSMKQLILLKQSTSIQIAHLYEHLFCSQLDTFLREHSLYQGLDYCIIGKTYYGGVIYVQIELYTDQAIQLAKELPRVAIRTDLDSILVATNQILAEKQEPIVMTSHDVVIKDLQHLQAQSWQEIDQIKQIDTKSVRRRSGSFYIAEGKPVISSKLSVNLILDKEIVVRRRDLLPLFQQMSQIIMGNIISDFADAHGYYSVDESFKLRADSAVYSNIFRIGKANVQLDESRSNILELVRDMRNDGTFERLSRQLRAVSYFDWQTITPNLERMYEDTLIFIGTKGWEEIATPENCELLLEHTSATVKFGREKATALLINKE